MNEIIPEIGEIGDVVISHPGGSVMTGRYRGIVVGYHTSQSEYGLVKFFDPPKYMADYCAYNLSHQGGLWACQRPEWQKDEARTDEEAAAQAAIVLGGFDALQALLA